MTINFEILKGRDIKGAYISIEPFFYEDWAAEHHSDSIYIHEDAFIVAGYIIGLFQSRYSPYEITYLGRNNGNKIADVFDEFGTQIQKRLDLQFLVKKYVYENADQNWLMNIISEQPEKNAHLLIQLSAYLKGFLKRSEVVSIVGV